MAWSSHQSHERNSQVQPNQDLAYRVGKLEEGFNSEKAVWRRWRFWMSVIVIALGIALVSISIIALTLEGK